MFLGTIPAAARPILREIVTGWNPTTLAVGCSGNFTIERTMADLGIELLSCDVSLYSYALGSALSGQPVDIRLSARGRELVPWAGDYFGDADHAAIMIMLLLDYAPSLAHPERHYSQHVLAALEREWAGLHERGLAKFQAKRPVQVASYFNGDVRQFIAELPADTPFMSFPPFYCLGYERMFKVLGEMVEWPAPAYDIIDDNAIEGLLSSVQSRISGRANQARRQALVEGHPCAACGSPATELDHIVPLFRGGEEGNPANLQPLCAPCHVAKSTRDWLEAKAAGVESLVRAATYLTQ